MERKLSLLDAYTKIPKRIGVMSMTREEAIKYIESWLLDTANNKIYVVVE